MSGVPSQPPDAARSQYMDGCIAADRGAIARQRIETLASEQQTKLARYLRRMVGDADVALDLTQDVFFSAYRMLQSDPSRELRAGWLYRAATNAAISHMRRRKVLQFVALDREPDAHGWRIDERSAASLDLQAAISRLPADQSAALLLTTYAGYSSAEAAAILRTSAEAVRQRVCRAMKTLRHVMHEENVS
jgi:RNA polymerase sigma-70 factor (ECF subfamily)